MNRPRVAVINVVALSPQMMAHMPHLTQWATGQNVTAFLPTFPALTCSAQSTYMTGKNPEEHAIPANGWYHRSLCDVQFWKQPEKLIRGRLLWDTLKERYGTDFRCAKLFWWYNMYSSADWTITPRPMYPADGRKVFDIYTKPMELREEIKHDLGEFPFPTFWGPMTGIASTEWIAESAKWIENKYHPDLSLIYLPYLDYDLQKFGPSSEQAQTAAQLLDNHLIKLIRFFEEQNVLPLILSEYGISDTTQNISLNRIFRENGWISIKNELGKELLDCGASKAFAVADHQVALVYINDQSIRDDVRQILRNTPGVDDIRETSLQEFSPLVAERFPDFTVVAAPDTWFSYYYWTDDSKAPDFARCVDIHRKPGYDPAEMFFDPDLSFPRLKAATFLLKKKLGFRALLEVIPLNGELVRGSHGRDKVPEHQRPLFIGPAGLPEIRNSCDIHEAILAAFELPSAQSH